jgi:hypothetical protein
MTLEGLCDRFINEYAEKHCRSWKRDKARFTQAGTAYRELWKKRISEVIPADLVALHNLGLLGAPTWVIGRAPGHSGKR